MNRAESTCAVAVWEANPDNVEVRKTMTRPDNDLLHDIKAVAA
jgi:hypothetical protein